ncbi:MAG: mechanosensitive ion channel family protein [Rhodoferax sp.]
MTEFLNLIFEPLQEVFLNFKIFLPNLLAMFVILLLGLVLAKLIRLILVKALNAINFDSLCDRVGMTALMRKGDLWSKPSVALATIVFWLLVIVTLMIALSALRLPAIDHLVTQFFAYLPRAFSAVLILIVGFLLAGFISRAVLIAAVNSAYHYAKLLAEAVRMLLTVLILAMAMEQLQVAPSIVLAAFSIIFGGIVIALAIAFGVGGIDAARRMIERENDADQKDEIEHL